MFIIEIKMRCIITIISILFIFNQCLALNHGLQQEIYEIKQKKISDPEPLPSFLEMPLPEKTVDQLRINHLFLPPISVKRNADAPAESNDILSIYPLEKLRFVGLLTDKNRRWALIILPNQQVIYAKEGDKIGTDHAQIKIIEEQKIILSTSFPNPDRTLNKEINVPMSSENLES